MTGVTTEAWATAPKGPPIPSERSESRERRSYFPLKCVLKVE